MENKKYSTRLVIMWLDNWRDNYNACKAIEKRMLNNDKSLKVWLMSRYYKDDYNKINFNNLDMEYIRQAIKSNQE